MIQQVTHAVPRGDLFEHVTADWQYGVRCWCCPTAEEDGFGSILVEHVAADGREDYQTGRRKPS
jgi:hypothetical protein